MEHVQGLQGRLIRLVPIELERHLNNYYRWLNDPEVSEHLLVEFPIPMAVERDWVDKMVRNPNDVVFAIETLGGRHLGTSAIHDINWRHGFATTGSFIGEAEERGKGYGTEAAILRARYAFHVLGLRQLHSSFLEGNTQSKRMQEKLGAVEVGCVPAKFYKRGQFRGETLTLLTRERFEELHGPGLGQ